ncbi:unnamed protein product [Paramecium pentaurelia]|uniref:Transmembrane protein n=1 Tax=Paramecium pentaurelia TaxID=43138 RepID=A0A8S1YPH0_9CILI|nr:unnamed protein product [Paramecium pentaurelia]
MQCWRSVLNKVQSPSLNRLNDCSAKSQLQTMSIPSADPHNNLSLVQESNIFTLMTFFIYYNKQYMKSGLILIFSLILIQMTQQDSFRYLKKSNSLLKKNHQNVLSYQAGALISSRQNNFFNNGNNGVCLRDNLYNFMTGRVPYTGCGLGKQVSISLLQKYLLNTLKIWFWDYGYNEGDRYYYIKVYAILDQKKTDIYDSNSQNPAISQMTIQFKEQHVDKFQILNLGGNTYNAGLHIIKVEAYYKFQ